MRPSPVVGLLLPIAILSITSSRSPEAKDTPGYALRPVPLTAVHLTDTFWRAYMDRNRSVTLPHILDQNDRTGRVANFEKAAARLAGGTPGPFEGKRYNDSDVYKAIEAASYLLATQPDPGLDRRLDELIRLVAAAQEPDGYLYTARTVNPQSPPPGAGPARWAFLSTSHELYNVGHLYEAAVAHYAATGKRTLLDVAIRNADLVVRTFGPDALRSTSGHQEIELALVKLWKVTGNDRYLQTARFLLEERGGPHEAPTFPADSPFAIYNDRAYRQDHLPVLRQERAVGHAVRATYMYSGMTDVGRFTGDSAFDVAVDRLWRDVVSRRMYVTGGLGSTGETEAFGDDYVLPNRAAYAETCASVGGLLWYHRMFLRGGDARYLDVFERTLYNGFLSGVSLAGDTFFYENPLASDGTVERKPYFDVACCPANLSRLLGQLPGLVYAQADGVVYVNLFIGSEAAVTLGDVPVRIAQDTRYPHEGLVTVRVTPERPTDFALMVRLPGWARGEAVPSDLYRYEDPPGPAASGAAPPPDPPRLLVNGDPVAIELVHGFAKIQRRWRDGDRVELRLPMQPRRVLAHPGIAEDGGRVALERGPLVYCLEAADNGGRVSNLVVPRDAPLRAEDRPTLLGGVHVVVAHGRALGADGRSSDRDVIAVPYYAWANRGKGEMTVWIPEGR